MQCGMDCISSLKIIPSPAFHLKILSLLLLLVLAVEIEANMLCAPDGMTEEFYLDPTTPKCYTVVQQQKKYQEGVYQICATI